ncbi:hypothetical protein YC2023_020786 [Brassica napus]
MQNLRNGEKGDSHWIQFMLFVQFSITTLLLKCLGLESSSSSSSSSSVSSHGEEEDGIEMKEDEDDMTVETTERRLQKRGMTEEKEVLRRKVIAKWLKENIWRLGPTFNQNWPAAFFQSGHTSSRIC